jgi:hypothetical protein
MLLVLYPFYNITHPTHFLSKEHPTTSILQLFFLSQNCTHHDARGTRGTDACRSTSTRSGEEVGQPSIPFGTVYDWRETAGI